MLPGFDISQTVTHRAAPLHKRDSAAAKTVVAQSLYAALVARGELVLVEEGFRRGGSVLPVTAVTWKGGRRGHRELPVLTRGHLELSELSEMHRGLTNLPILSATYLSTGVSRVKGPSCTGKATFFTVRHASRYSLYILFCQ